MEKMISKLYSYTNMQMAQAVLEELERLSNVYRKCESIQEFREHLTNRQRLFLGKKDSYQKAYEKE